MDSYFESVHVNKLGQRPKTCLEASGNLQGISQFVQESTPARENSFGNPKDSRGTPSLVPLIIPTLPTIAHLLTYPSPLVATTPFAPPHTHLKQPIWDLPRLLFHPPPH
ncbi:hypothetical protein K443DRAFT_464836 [Laccaria amethystina LaAM-08-1]|uniref:Uncharacterized protein n=1 Tax=Laccaria amethystina LaAM-08-1 TaxID=1095629 RepID=A0A0C9Y6I1_9AGAR|nr:hypothetical protein K443DRAFT_464836 [Laccaria amethystina LaAM-08-1]